MNDEQEYQATRMFEGQLDQLEKDLDYFGEQLFENPLTDAEKYLVGRALDAFISEGQAVEDLRRRIAAVNAEQLMQARRKYG
jgi:hypothetical protein